MGGSISVTTDGVVTYTAPAGVTGITDKFAFTVTDGKGGVGVGVVNITL
ncbi:Ig-like domain-containing protein [Kaarinaea lacus]